MRVTAPARGSVARGSAVGRPFAAGGPPARAPPRRAAAVSNSAKPIAASSRRVALLELAAAAAAAAALPSLAGGGAPALAAQQPQAPQVGTYLPAAEGLDGLVRFVPDPKKTPALRAGMVNAAEPYSFALPPSFREARVANIASGNYCAPRCDEPWTEVIFESASDGRISLIVSPLVKLTRAKGARIEDIGPPEGLLTSLGSYITGTFLDEDDVVGMAAKRQDDGRTYYYYEVNAPYAKGGGPHSYAACTTKGDLALLFVASASDKQWAGARDSLVKAAESFRA